MCLPSDSFILTLLNKYVLRAIYRINTFLATGDLYNRRLIFKFASYKCRLKNKAVLILSKRFSFGFSLLMLMILRYKTAIIYQGGYCATMLLFWGIGDNRGVCTKQNIRRLIQLSFLSAVLFLGAFYFSDGGNAPLFVGVFCRTADKDGVIYPPYWNTEGDAVPRQKQGSRTQSTLAHKNGNEWFSPLLI